MVSFRRHLTYANVVSTIALFLVLGGATAFAAKQLAKNSVGTKQLKKNAVTAAKIKNGAVNGAKLGAGSVDGSKLANGAVTTPTLGKGSVTADKIAPGVLPQPLPDPLPGLPVVHRLQNVTSLEFPTLTKTSHPIPLPLEHATYTQAAGEDDLIVASLEVHIPASCGTPRSAAATLRMDAGNGSFSNEFIGSASTSDDSAGDKDVRVQFVGGGNTHGIVISAPSAPTEHTFSVEIEPATCIGRSEIPSHIVATGVRIDVIGFKP